MKNLENKLMKCVKRKYPVIVVMETLNTCLSSTFIPTDFFVDRERRCHLSSLHNEVIFRFDAKLRADKDEVFLKDQDCTLHIEFIDEI